MLHFLLLLSSLSAVTDGTNTFNISYCPMGYYGIISNTLLFHSWSTTRAYSLCLENRSNCMNVKSTVPDVNDVKMERLDDLPDVMVDKLRSLYFRNQTVHCAFKVSFVATNKTEDAFYFAKVDTYSLVYVHSANDLQVGIAVSFQGPLGSIGGYYHSNVGPLRFVFDLTGCRLPHGGVRRVEAWRLLKICKTNKGCRPDNSLDIHDLCDANMQCDRNGGCVPRAVTCSIIASVVIDSADEWRSVRDSCSYTLVSTKDLHLLGKFGYRQQTHSPFVSSLVLTMGSTTFQLLPGGEVYVNETRVNLNSSTQTFDRVTLSKDQTGVTLLSSDVEILFDGTFLHIYEHSELEKEGLCLDSGKSGQKKYRLMDRSERGCRRTYNDKPDKNIDRAALTKKCESLFFEEPDYVKICSHLLGRYGNIDSLMCHIQNAFTTRIGDPISDPNCVWPRPCMNYHCAPFEFCGETDEGQAKCKCRKSFTDLYLGSGQYGEKTTCEEDISSIEVPVCVLESRGFDVTELHLLDRNCKGYFNADTHMMGFNFTHSELCGATVTTNGTHIVYSNVVSVLDLDDAVITRDEDIYMNFSCIYEQPESKGLVIEIVDRSVSKIFGMGRYKYNVTMKACLEEECDNKVRRNDALRLRRRLWISLDVEALDDSLALLIHSCWATANRNSKSRPRHKLITNGCADPGDRKVRVTENGDGDKASFYFSVFKFKQQQRGEVHLFCKVSLCLKGNTNNCVPACPAAAVGRRRRSVDTEWTETWRTMSWIYEGDFAEGD